MEDQIKGIRFSFQIAPSGGIAQTSGMDKLRQNIIHILLTNTGERVMRRDYGGGLRQLVHDPNNDALRAFVEHQINKAIEQSEPRVQIESLTISQEQQEGLLLIDLTYTVRQTQQPQSISASLDLRSV